jgi:hypothetical protein
MDTRPGQTTAPNDDNSDLGQLQQLTAGISPEPVLPPERPGGMGPTSIASLESTLPPIGDANWQYAQESALAYAAEPLPEDIAWTASEFIEHKKSVGWYGLLLLVGVVLASGDYFVTKDIISTSVILLAAVMFGVYAARKPRTQQYHLSPHGLQVAQRLYEFHSFKNFSIADEDAIVSIVFIPLARFSPPLTIYVAPDLEGRIVDYLSLFLPFEQHHTDAIDGLLRRIHF